MAALRHGSHECRDHPLTRPLRTGRAAAGILVFGLAGCGGIRVAERDLGQDLVWPPKEPRLRLERVIELERRTGFLGGLIGASRDQPLFGRPYGVAWQGGAILVSDPSAGRIVRIDADGRVTSSAEARLRSPVGVARCPPGVLVTDSRAGRIARLDRDLRFEAWIAEGLHRPTGIACDESRIYVVETARHRVLVLTSDGRRVRVFGERGDGPGQFNFPTTIALDGNEIVVGDTLNFRVQRLDATTGAFRSAFGGLGDAAGDMPRIKGLAVDALRHIWVSDAHTDTVSLFDASGELLISLGGPGFDPGRFSFPAGIAATPDGRVAVVDTFNRRVQVFRLIGAAE